MAVGRERVRVHGVTEVNRALKALELDVDDLRAVHTAVARQLIGGVRSRTPVRTGALAGSWDPGATKTRARVTSPLVYAGPIEWGYPKHNIAPARMVRATIEAEQEQIVKTYEDALAKLAAREDLEVVRR